MSLGRGFTVWQHQETGQFDRRSEPASGGCRQRNEPKYSVSQKCHGVQIVESQFAAFILGGYDPVAGRIRERRTEKRECEESAQKAPRRSGRCRAFETHQCLLVAKGSYVGRTVHPNKTFAST